MAEKICVICSADVSKSKRVKDSQGRYYCEPCAARARQRAVAAPVEASVGEEPAGGSALDFAAAESALSAATSNMFACAGCKKLVPEKQIRNDDGEFLCLACFQRRRGGTPKTAVAKAFGDKKTEVYDDQNPETWKDTLAGGLTISGGVLVLSLAAWTILEMVSPMPRFPQGFGWALVFGGLQTVFIFIRAALLMVSMVIAARILGGIEFGYIGSALWKALAVVLAFALLDLAMERFETLGLIGLSFKFILVLLAFMAVFRIDYFEAFLLAIVNFFVFIGIGIGLTALLVSFSSGLVDDGFSSTPRQPPPAFFVPPADDNGDEELVSAPKVPATTTAKAPATAPAPATVPATKPAPVPEPGALPEVVE